MEYTARDIAKALLADGVQPGTQVAEARDYDLALSRADPEGRLASRVIRAAERELGIVMDGPDAAALDYRQAGYLIDRLGGGLQ